MHNFKELIVWQKARELVKDIYILTEKFPDDEKFGLTSQIKRAAVSVASNIAEGSGRGTDKECVRFLDMANGSAFEIETQLYLAYDLHFVDEDLLNKILEQVTEVQKLIYGFKARLLN